jgi:hypothetical protein
MISFFNIEMGVVYKLNSIGRCIGRIGGSGKDNATISRPYEGCCRQVYFNSLVIYRPLFVTGILQLRITVNDKCVIDYAV